MWWATKGLCNSQVKNGSKAYSRWIDFHPQMYFLQCLPPSGSLISHWGSMALSTTIALVCIDSIDAIETKELRIWSKDPKFSMQFKIVHIPFRWGYVTAQGEIFCWGTSPLALHLILNQSHSRAALSWYFDFLVRYSCPWMAPIQYCTKQYTRSPCTRRVIYNQKTKGESQYISKLWILNLMLISFLTNKQ